MDLETLVNELAARGRIRPTRLRDIRSSARRYARMLGCPDPQSCPEEVYALGRRARHELIERELKDASSHVLRNVKNNVSFILRHGEELGLIRPTPEDSEKMVPKQFGRRIIGDRFPSLMASKVVGYLQKNKYSLPLDEWPEKLKGQYEDWKHWVTEAEVPRHYLNPRNRPATVENKTKKFEAFFGYLSQKRKLEDLDFEMLIDVQPYPPAQKSASKFIRYRKQSDVGLLEEFVRWHQGQRLERASAQAREVVSAAGSVARRYFFLKARLNGRHEEAAWFDLLAEEISRRRMALEEEQPGRLIAVEQRKVSRAELLKAAQAEFPQRNQQSGGGSGAELAARAGRAVAIMLLVHHPLRNRYYREAQVGRELVEKEKSKWYLRVNENEAKKRGLGKQGVREQPVSSEVISYLERYLEDWHPKLVKEVEYRLGEIKNSGERQAEQIEEMEKYKKYLFLNSRGRPFTRVGFAGWIQSATYRWLGVRVNPELIRLIALNR